MKLSPILPMPDGSTEASTPPSGTLILIEIEMCDVAMPTLLASAQRSSAKNSIASVESRRARCATVTVRIVGVMSVSETHARVRRAPSGTAPLEYLSIQGLRVHLDLRKWRTVGHADLTTGRPTRTVLRRTCPRSVPGEGPKRPIPLSC